MRIEHISTRKIIDENHKKQAQFWMNHNNRPRKSGQKALLVLKTDNTCGNKHIKNINFGSFKH